MSENEVVVIENNHESVSLIKDNETIKKENNMALAVVQSILHNKPDPVEIRGKRHLEYEDWIALGNAYGITVGTGDAEPVEIFGAKGFKAYAKLIRVADGVIIGGAEAYCLNDESNWEDRDYFQMASMAQTRAGSKALSNALRGVVALDKSLNGTPGEEMSGSIKDTPKPKPKAPAPAPKKAPTPKSNEPDTVIVEAEVIQDEGEEKSNEKSLKQLGDENKEIKMAITQLQQADENINKGAVMDKLLDLLDMGKFSKESYDTAYELLMN